MTNRHTTARATALIAGALAATLALAGCVPADPTPTPTPTKTASPTPTPTPTEVAAPTTEQEAIDQAELALQRYFAMETVIFTDPGKPVDVAAVAEGQAAERLTSFADQMAELGGSGTGDIQFEVQTAYAVPLTVNGEEVPFGQVNLKGCYDLSSLDLLKADGSPADMPSVRRYVMETTAVFRSSTSSWVAYTVPIVSEVTPC